MPTGCCVIVLLLAQGISRLPLRLILVIQPITAALFGIATILKYTYSPYASDNNATHPRQNVLQYGVGYVVPDAPT